MLRKCKDWIASYLEYTSEQESPDAFHEWTALAVLSATTSRHLFLPRGYYTIFPNMYIVLVAGSAKCRKSVSSHIGISLLEELKNKPMVFSQKITNEALIKALLESKIDGNSSGIIYASELSVFMGRDAIGTGLIPTLTDLYDSPRKWEYHTRTRGVEILENVSLCMLGASTIDWLRSCIPPDAVGGGFTSRVVFIYQEAARKPILFPERKASTEVLRKDLVEDLNHIRTQRGQMALTPEAKLIAQSWYEEEIGRVHDTRLEGYFGRKHDTMFKVATLLSIASSDERWITEEHIQKALNLLAQHEDGLGKIMSIVTSNETGEKSDKVLAIIRKNGKMQHVDLLKQCWRFGNAMELAQHLQTLSEAGEILISLSPDNRTRVYEIAKRRV